MLTLTEEAGGLEILYDALTDNDDEYPESPPFIEIAKKLFRQIFEALAVDD
jgi:hypothetical protein